MKQINKIMMVKKIGKFYKLLILLNLFFNICADDFNLILKAIDFENTQITEVAVGVPFLMNLIIESVHNFNDLTQPPYIEKLVNGKISDVGQSTTIKTINGRTTIVKTFQYEVRIDKEGFYHLGPAKIEINKQEFKSNVLKLNVVSELTTNKNKSEPEILKLSIDKDKLFLNEHAKLSIKFYHQDEHTQLLNIENPDLKDFSFDAFELVSSGTQEINDRDYFYQEYIANIYPKKTGELLIPSVTAFYEESKNNLNLFMSFFNQIQRKKINSSALKINVKALPNSKVKIDAVGQFNKFNAMINQNIAVEGEGILFKLELEGRGDFNNIDVNTLNLPEHFKYYESTNKIIKKENGLEQKTFEYILQSNQSGEIEIPTQQFNYFDPQAQIYKKLFTMPISVKIIPLPPEEKVKINNLEEENVEDHEVNINTIIHTYEVPIKKEFIGFRYFLILLFLPILISLILIFKNYFLKNYKTDPLKKLQKKVNHFELKKDKKMSQLYEFFIEYFANKFKVNPSIITQEFIEEKFKDYNMPPDLIKKWNLYFIKLNELSYGIDTKTNYSDLLEEAKIWTIIFNEKLKS